MAVDEVENTGREAGNTVVETAAGNTAAGDTAVMEATAVDTAGKDMAVMDTTAVSTAAAVSTAVVDTAVADTAVADTDTVEALAAKRYAVHPDYRVNVRSGPGTNYQLVRVLPYGATVPINCQKPGETISGPYGTTNLWDNIANGQFISDAYVYTGSDGYVAPRCG